MTNKLEKKLLEIFIKIAKKETTFWQSNELYSESLKESNNASKEEITNETKEKMAKIFIIFVGKNEDYCEDLVKGKFRFTNESLNSLEKNFKEILKKIDLIHDKLPQVIGVDYVTKTKESIRESKKLIELGREFTSLEDKLAQFEERKNFSWQRIKKVWDEVKEKSSAARSNEWLTKTAQMIKWSFLGEIVELCWQVAKTTKEGEEIPPNVFPSTAEDLSFFQEVIEEVPKMIDWLERKYTGEIKDKETKIQKIKANNEELKKFIQQERKKHGYSSSTNGSTNNKPNFQQNIQQIQDLQNEINSLNQKMTELQNQIVKVKSQSNSADQSANQEVQQEIEKLESQEQQIRTQLSQKYAQQKELNKSENTQQSGNEKQFNWLYVVIPGAVLLVAFGIIIVYLLGKKSKKE